MGGNASVPGTRREFPVGAGTRHEASGGGTRREGVAAGWTRVNLPPELAERFSIVEELGSGGEGFVLRVEDSAGTESVVKLYFPKLTFDERATSLLAGAAPDHVLRVVPGEAADGSRYEVLEWCEHGSLRDLLNDGHRLDLARVVTELSQALEHIHGLRLDGDPDARLVHQDLKPDNVMVRTLDPLDLVLGDFGLARMIAGSRHYTNRQQGSRAWAPPSGEAVTAGWDWWSLGMIVAEVATGRHPFCIDGEWLSDAAISDHLSQGPVDLSDIDDDRVLTLCRGLLIRRTADRWGAPQVHRWLAGETVRVVADTGGGERRRRTVLFNGTEHSGPAELALALQQDWDQAQERLIQRTDGGALSQQVALLLSAAGLTDAEGLLKDIDHPPTRLATLLAEMNPDLPPFYRSHDLRPAALAHALTDPRTAGSVVRLIEDPKQGLAATGVMTCWRHLEGMSNGPVVETRLQDAKAFLLSQDKTLSVLPLSTVDAIKAAVYSIAIQPDSIDGTRTALQALDTSAARQQAWWLELATADDDYATVLARLTEPFAREQTDRQNATKEAERLAAEEAAGRAAEARKRESARHRRRLRFGILKGLVWPALISAGFSVFFTYGPPAIENQDKYGLPVFADHTNQEALTYLLVVSAIGLLLIFLGAALQIPHDPTPYRRYVYLGWGCTLGVATAITVFAMGVSGDLETVQQTKRADLNSFLWFPIIVGAGALIEGLIRRSSRSGDRG